jgi:hypothetical protein
VTTTAHFLDVTDQETRDLVADWQMAAEAVDQWTDRMRYLASELIARLPDGCDGITFDGTQVARVVKGGTYSRLDAKALEKAYPEVAMRFYVDSHRATHLRRINK